MIETETEPQGEEGLPPPLLDDSEAAEAPEETEPQEEPEPQEETESTMAMPTPVNGQITDAVTQANLAVVGDAPAQAMGMVMLSAAQAQSLAGANAAAAQQQAFILAQAVTTSCVQALLGSKS